MESASEVHGCETAAVWIQLCVMGLHFKHHHPTTPAVEKTPKKAPRLSSNLGKIRGRLFSAFNLFLIARNPVVLVSSFWSLGLLCITVYFPRTFLSKSMGTWVTTIRHTHCWAFLLVYISFQSVFNKILFVFNPLPLQWCFLESRWFLFQLCVSVGALRLYEEAN